MNFKPWKLTLLAALSVSGSAALAQNTSSVQRAFDLERYGEARSTLLKQGGSTESNFELGRLYQLRDMPDSAAYYFNRISLNQKDPVTLIAAGRAALAKGKTAEAEIQFDSAVKASKGKDAKVYTMIAQAYAESDIKDITKALTYVDAAQKLNKGKDDPTLMIARGDIYLKTEQGGGEAMNSYERATMADPNNVKAYVRKGQLNMRARTYNEAKTNLDKAISIDPNYAPAYNALAETYYFAGRYDDALAQFQKFTSLAEKSTNTDAKYASFLYLTKKYPEALTEINKVLAANPNDLTMNRLKAYSLYEQGQNEEALAAMQKYMQIANASNKVITEDNVYYGKMLIKSGKTTEGAAIIKKAIDADPKKASELQNELAQAYIAAKDYPNAIATYRARMKANDGGELTDKVYLARAYELNDQYAQADSLYGMVLTERPTYVPGYQMRARANANLDKDSKQGLAKPYYEKYIEVASGADAAKYKTGLIEANKYLGSYYLFTKNDKAASLPYWQQVLVLDPADQQAKTAVSEINKPATKAPAKRK
ncbi:tetratricopeptide repeat protein [Hymenobacter taeanensis]|uniref:Tetratricopeptide repeat protein n=1 Tax=Hymenobacter taeanensis TaxID=2735321 RepID=A0A6M6BH73_9BACT|nr:MULTISPECIES: tetratricopeptide repeat protein [Hymenobacter]QJX47144.1 tetratricopeptide repeat protein [Hymenobacter taeanensis]UOQ81060.1 tetratricopeptide repeat protein [Hymenobacter sp. 5414T-23]